VECELQELLAESRECSSKGGGAVYWTNRSIDTIGDVDWCPKLEED
jgi:hypothetical protein